MTLLVDLLKNLIPLQKDMMIILLIKLMNLNLKKLVTHLKAILFIVILLLQIEINLN